MTCKFARTEQLAREFMAKHGIADTYMFRFSKHKRYAGYCWYPHNGKPGVIELSRNLVELNSEEKVVSILLHEIAHALCGKKHGHDAVWQATCVSIGGSPERYYDEVGVEMPQGKWVAYCTNCGREFRRHRLPARKIKWMYHPKCGPDRGKLTAWKSAHLSSDS